MIGDKIWKLTNVIRVRLPPHATHSQRQTTFPGNWNGLFSVGWPSSYFLLCQTGGRPSSYYKAGGPGVRSNHDKEAHRGSHSVFNSLI